MVWGMLRNFLLLLAMAAVSHAGTGKVAAFLRQISGKATVGGVHNDQKVGGVTYYTDRLASVTGRVPGLWSADFSYDNRIQNRWAVAYEAERQWRAGALVNLMWHACPPTQPEPCSWEGGIHAKLSDAQWKDLLTEGGVLNREWKRRLDRIAPYLEYLQGKGVEALWRPHHEMNQENFWWGGRPGRQGTAGLYRITYDYLTRMKGIGNLAWTWDIQDLRFDWDGYHPGEDCFDVMALDMYSMGYTDSLYRLMLRLAGGKPIALGEVGRVPTPAALEKHPRYAFVMAWAYMALEENSAAALKETYTAANVLTRDEMPGWDNVGIRIAAPRAARPGALRFERGVLKVTLPGDRAASDLRGRLR